MRSASALLLLPAVLAAPHGGDGWFGKPSGPHRGQWHHEMHGGNKAAYFLDNRPDGSSLVSMHIGADGMLSEPARMSTGGFGRYTLNVTTGEPVGADTLQSQYSVRVAGDLLFTMNVGSNTLVMYRIDPADPWHPKMVGEPADTLGEFPLSVDYSEELKTACVLNGGAKAGVTCFYADPYHGLKVKGGLRSLSSPIFMETTPPTGPPQTASQISFTPDMSAVLAIVKGGGDAPYTDGYVVSYPIEHGQVSMHAEPNKFADLPTAFGAVFLDESRLFISDPSFGIAILDVSNPAEIKEVAHTVTSSQKAMCWAQHDSMLQTAYGIDAGQPMIYTYDPKTGAMTGNITGTEETGGFFDSEIMDGYMYSLAASNGVAVVDLAKEEQVQYLDLSSFGMRQGYDGMAVWPSW